MTELYLELGAPLGVDSAAPCNGRGGADRVELHVDPATARAARDALPAGPVLAVAPGSAFGPSKIYPPRQLASALRAVEEQLGLRPVLLGPPSERKLAAAVQAAYDCPFLACGLAEKKALLANAAALLCMDSGARHLAAALGVPQVVLYGPTDPRWTAFALERTVRLRREDLDCSPCHLSECPIDHPCLRGISAQEIVGGVRRALALAHPTSERNTSNGTGAHAGPV